MLRRFLLVGLFSIVRPGSIAQLVAATMFCVLYLTIQLQAAPFKRAADNFLALCISMFLVCLFFCCVILKTKVLVETPEVDAVLSPKLRDLFNVPVIALSSIMLVSILGAVAL